MLHRAMSRVLLFFVPWLLVACQEQRDLHTPAGALAALVEAYSQEDGVALYGLVSEQSHAQIHEAWTALNELRSLTTQSLPLEVREKAKTDGGLSLLDNVTDEIGLFARLCNLDEVVADAGVIYGAGIHQAEVDEAKGTAKLLTRTGQSFEFVREQDGSWRARHLESILEKRLRILRNNLSQVKAYVLAIKERDEKVQKLRTGTLEELEGATPAAEPGGPASATGSPQSAAAASAAAAAAPAAEKPTGKKPGKGRGKGKRKPPAQ